MKIRYRLAAERYKEVAKSYELGESMIGLAKRYGKTRQGIWHILQQAGVDTTKRRVEVRCARCGKKLMRGKKRAGTTKHHFCSRDCYFSWREEHADKTRRYIKELIKKRKKACN